MIGCDVGKVQQNESIATTHRVFFSMPAKEVQPENRVIFSEMAELTAGVEKFEGSCRTLAYSGTSSRCVTTT
jgi:hypothetical protein